MFLLYNKYRKSYIQVDIYLNIVNYYDIIYMIKNNYFNMIYLQPNNYTITNNITQVWDKQYHDGRYHVEPALAFTDNIIKELKSNLNLKTGRGLYVGCGNGRNYSKLIESDKLLNITGLDVSSVALKQLAEKIPQCVNMLEHCDFLDYKQKNKIPFQYIISIQVFQHGNEKRTNKYFEKTSSLLEKDGLLFLRVNASNTVISFKHNITEKSNTGSFTIRYKKGPKQGLDIRFFSKEDICNLLSKNNMSVINNKNITTKRILPQIGTWSQWELIAKKIDV